MGLVEEGGKVGTAAVGAMSAQPLAIALLVVNIGFLGFAGYVLGEVAANASERNKGQMDLIAKLVGDIRDCVAGATSVDYPLPAELPMTKLTENFSVEEFTDSQTAARLAIRNVPGTREYAHLERLAAVMERVRTILGHPVLISSGYRSAKVNAAVGGATKSQHIHGLACDFTSPGFGTPLEICLKLEPHMIELQIDQLINEFPPSGWVHLGLSEKQPRHQCLTIDISGTRVDSYDNESSRQHA